MKIALGNAAAALAVGLILSGSAGIALARDAPSYKCDGGKTLPAPGNGENLLVTGTCIVPEGSYTYGNVNVIAARDPENPANSTQGSLRFMDARIDFHAKSILIENGGSLLAGVAPDGKTIAPIGTNPDGRLTIHLYGEDQGQKGAGINCATENCGIPAEIWCSQPRTAMDEGHGAACSYPDTHQKVKLPNAADDWFYRYHPLTYDGGNDKETGKPGYFGYKVLAVSYGGTLQLFGKRGSTFDGEDPNVVVNSGSGTSWRRLAATARVGSTTIELDQAVDWKKGDEIVITTTDYLPGHSEKRTLAADPKGTSVTLTQPLTYVHNGSQFDLTASGVPARLGLVETKMENRAAVALLTRSIRIVSDGDTAKSGLPAKSYFGGHTIVRQGAAKVQVQGVEFENLGQGGRIGHYPVHFHLARKAPLDTFVKDNSVNESMTRWVVLHGTHNVTLARNVGWKSIGHGFYLEEGTEIDNNLFSNIGIYARAALDFPDNPRKVPGILAAALAKDPKNPNDWKLENVPFYSDYDHPSVFWIMNGWNRFEGNMAVGASACGVCYWMLPGAVSGHSRDQQWEGYASIQMGAPENATSRAGFTPVKSFTGNFCSTAAMSFNTTANTAACLGIGTPDVPGYISIPPIANPVAPPPCDQSNPKQKAPNQDKYEPYSCNQPANKASLDYYPQVGGGGRFPTKCDAKDGTCASVPYCGSQKSNVSNCMVTVIDRYTTSFNWTEQNFAAIWLRPQWYLVSNSFITDVVNSGLTFVTGGGYTESDAVYGHWALAYRNVFIGQTQDPAKAGDAATAFTSHLSPFNNLPQGLKCAQGAGEGNRCVSQPDGVSFPRSNFGVNQRLFNIYDGPAYQSSNAYLNITKAPIDCGPNKFCPAAPYLVAKLTGLPKDRATGGCYMPNAAIGWKQPNGFYYPPAFHSDNLYFHNVEIRHFVTQPLFKQGTYLTDDSEGPTGVKANYCNWTSDMFNNWTDIDRQTELNDDDGTLTGYSDTISVNKDPFFSAPQEGIECNSDETAKTSPYDYVTSVVYPDCGTTGTCGTVTVGNGSYATWNQDCANETCSGVPLYRQYDADRTGPRHAIQMAGQSTYQRSTLAANNGLYYVDTTQSAEAQVKMQGPRSLLNVFQAGKTYYSFLLYAKPSTRQSYQIYVGKSPEGDQNGFNLDDRRVAGACRHSQQSAGFHQSRLDAEALGEEVRQGNGHPRGHDGHDRGCRLRSRLQDRAPGRLPAVDVLQARGFGVRLRQGSDHRAGRGGLLGRRVQVGGQGCRVPRGRLLGLRVQAGRELRRPRKAEDSAADGMLPGGRRRGLERRLEGPGSLRRAGWQHLLQAAGGHAPGVLQGALSTTLSASPRRRPRPRRSPARD